MAEQPGALKRIIAGNLGALAEGVGVPGSFLESLSGLLGGTNPVTGKGLNDFSVSGIPFNLPTQQGIRQNVVEPIAEATVGKESLKPANAFEDILQRTSRGVPISALTGGFGGGIAQGLGRGLAGSTALKGAEELNLPVPVQLFAGMAAEGGFDKLANWASKNKVPVENLATMAKQAKDQFYAKEAELGSKIYTSPSRYQETLENVENGLKSTTGDIRLSPTQKSEILSAIDSLKGDVADTMVPVSRLVERRTQLNDLISKSSDNNVRNVYQQIRKPLIENIDEVGKTHPSWYKALKSADDIHAAINFPQMMLDKVSSIPKLQKVLTHPIASAAALLGPTLFFTRDPLKSLGAAFVGGSLNKLAQKGVQIGGFISGSAPRRVLMKASQHMLSNNIPAALNAYSKLNDMGKKFEKEQGQFQQRMLKRNKEKTKNLIPLN